MTDRRRTVRRSRFGRRASGVALTAIGLLGGACRSSDDDPARFCARVAEVPVVSDRDDLAVPDPATATGELVVALRRVRAVAPSAIRDQVALMVEVTEAVQRAVTAPPGPERDAARREVDERSVAWRTASAEVVDYAASTCGIDLTARR